MLRKHIQCHMRRHIIVSCSICGIECTMNWISKHMKLFHLSVKPFLHWKIARYVPSYSNEKFLHCKISTCNQTFWNEKELNEHQVYHIGIRRFRCPKCNCETSSMAALRTHMARPRALRGSTARSTAKRIQTFPKPLLLKVENPFKVASVGKRLLTLLRPTLKVESVAKRLPTIPKPLFLKVENPFKRFPFKVASLDYIAASNIKNPRKYPEHRAKIMKSTSNSWT